MSTRRLKGLKTGAHFLCPLIIIMLTIAGLDPLVLIGLSFFFSAIEGLFKMRIDKTVSGEDLTWGDVVRAIITGGPRGLFTLVGVCLGSIATDSIFNMLTQHFDVELLGQFCVKAGLFIAGSVIGTVADSLGNGIINTGERLYDGEETSLKTFGEAMWDNTGTSFLSSLVGSLISKAWK